MAALSDTDRAAIWAEFQSELSRDREPIAVTKTDLRAAFDALDDYFEANAAAMNQSIPQPARAALTKQQKARIAMFVIRKRYLMDS